MFHSILAGLLACLVFGASVDAQAASCAEELLARMSSELQRPFAEFDQSETTGWRPLSEMGCDSEAAQLVAKYIAGQEKPRSILFWHQAQLHALAGENAAALELAERAQRPPMMPGDLWNDYVSATMAFLEHDETAFESYRLILKRGVADDPSSMVNQVNKANLQVLNRLHRCFSEPYKRALACKDEE